MRVYYWPMPRGVMLMAPEVLVTATWESNE